MLVQNKIIYVQPKSYLALYNLQFAVSVLIRYEIGRCNNTLCQHRNKKHARCRSLRFENKGYRSHDGLFTFAVTCIVPSRWRWGFASAILRYTLCNKEWKIWGENGPQTTRKDDSANVSVVMWQQDLNWLDHDVEVNTEAGKMKTNTRVLADYLYFLWF